MDPIWQNKPNRSKFRGKKIPWEKKLVARAMLEQGMSTRKVGELVGMSSNTASVIARDEDLSHDNLLHLKSTIAGRFYKKSHRALDFITDDSLSRMNAYQNVLIAKIGLDAARMAEGLPTSIVQTRTLAVRLNGDIDTLRKRKDTLLARLGGTSVDVHDTTAEGNTRVRKVHRDE